MHLASLDPRTEFRSRVVCAEVGTVVGSTSAASQAGGAGPKAAAGAPSNGCAPEPQPRALKVWLDASYFYVEGGGQPGDRGSIAGLPVRDVVEECFPGADERSPGASACHIVVPATESEFTAAKELLDRALSSGEPVECVVDSQRRLEHSQQHTAQHILSRAAEILFDSDSSGFTIAEPLCVIEFARKLSADQLGALERETNRIISSCLPVTTTLLPDRPSFEERAAQYRIKDTAKYAHFPVRIVSIGEYDACPCCGTHLTNTGAAGLLKIFSSETSRGGTRVHFAAGARCLALVQEKLGILSGLAKSLTVADASVPRAVEGLQKELRATKRREKDVVRALMGCLAEDAARIGREEGAQVAAGASGCTLKLAGSWLLVSLIGAVSVAPGDALGLCAGIEKTRGAKPKPEGSAADPSPTPLVIFQNLEGEFCAAARGPQEKLATLMGILHEEYGCSGGGRESISIKFPGRLKARDIDALATRLAAGGTTAPSTSKEPN